MTRKPDAIYLNGEEITPGVIMPGAKEQPKDTWLFPDVGLKREAPPEMKDRNGSRKIAFGWYGGKFNHLGWLLPLLPKCHHYVEPFGGSAAVLLNREPSPIETYNDIDGEVVNFFRVLRKNKSAFTQLLKKSKRSSSRPSFGSKGVLQEDAAQQRAKDFVLSLRRMSRMLKQTETRAPETGRSAIGNMTMFRWLNDEPYLAEMVSRILRVQLDNRPPADCLDAYDDNDTLFFCSPSLRHRSYQPEGVFRLLNKMKAKIAVFGTLPGKQGLPPGHWKVHVPPEVSVRRRHVVLLTNY